jgi:hypothetical protein
MAFLKPVPYSSLQLVLTSTPLAEGLPKRVICLMFFFFLPEAVLLYGGIFKEISVEVFEIRMGC